ncbi:MAG: type II secretion system protein, partial [Oscillospiraceae bacterium]
FTLIELLIGVVILGIITVPLLHTFVTGANTERRSREYGEVTEAAQNLSEQIQGTDADLILSNASAVAPGANFYTLSGTTYTSVGSVAPAVSGLPKTYYVGIPNYTYGNRSFDALITLTVPDDSAASEPANSKAVVVGNQMDAILDMTKADENAVNALLAECGDLVSDVSTLNVNKLTRAVNFTVTKTIDSTTDTYKVLVSFDYSASIPYTFNSKSYTYYFAYSEQSSASVASVVDSAGPVFSVFLFYDAYYKSNVLSETLVINNSTGSDVNFFIVNTNKNSLPVGYKAVIWYKYQNFSGNEPVNKLIFTNLPTGNVTYRASRDALYRRTLTVSGYLAETKELSRKFDVSIKLFNSGSGFFGTPLIEMNSTRLNY